jgi:hypothetical protein
MTTTNNNLINEADKEEMTRLLNRLVDPAYFAEATRESGYKGTPSALAELVDNSLQAKATEIRIQFEESPDDSKEVWVYVLDNGCGMGRDVMDVALRFGGSTRFNDRSGTGRFGMGLPNASVSQARRLEIYSCGKDGQMYFCYLDLDQLAGLEALEPGFLTPIPINEWPVPSSLTEVAEGYPTGTLVVWKKCDRLDPKNVDGLRRKVVGSLGQTFRNFIYSIDTTNPEEKKPAHLITVNGHMIEPFDPLYLDPRAVYSGAEFKKEQDYAVSIPGKKGETADVTVKFSMLPVSEWQELPQQELRTRRVFDNKGFSVVRGGREIEVTDRHFYAGKGADGSGRILNDDAWWSCEISFDPVLDEIFGVTHTKQEIRPNMDVLQRIRHDITDTVGTMRAEYKRLRTKKTPAKTHPSEEKAGKNDKFLPPVPDLPQDPGDVEKKTARYAETYKREDETEEEARLRVQSKLYTIELESAMEGPFYRIEALLGSTVVYVNTDHEFYTELYSKVEGDPDASMAVSHLLFALARGERMTMTEAEGRKWYHSQRSVWSSNLHIFLGK